MIEPPYDGNPEAFFAKLAEHAKAPPALIEALGRRLFDICILDRDLPVDLAKLIQAAGNAVETEYEVIFHEHGDAIAAAAVLKSLRLAEADAAKRSAKGRGR
jgi:hypothetical protein